MQPYAREVLERVMKVVEAEEVPYMPDGLEAGGVTLVTWTMLAVINCMCFAHTRSAAAPELIAPLGHHSLLVVLTRVVTPACQIGDDNVREKWHIQPYFEAIVFTADGDMRQALNNLQATHSGFGYVNQENVFKVCDQPHPQVISDCIAHCLQAGLDTTFHHVVLQSNTVHLTVL